MDNLSLRQLQLFAIIAREGSLVKAAKVLGVTHSNLSMQMKSLEESLGADVFERRGRQLVLTPLGTELTWYADELLRLGRDVQEVAKGHSRPRHAPLRVGVVGSIPKLLAYRLLEPALSVDGFGPVAARQDTYEQLLEELAVGRLHLVVADIPPYQGGTMRLFGHLLGQSGIMLYGTRNLAKRYGKELPESLQDAPLLMPSRGTSLRRSLERWLTEQKVSVRVEGEFDDSGLMRIFGLQGRGIFPVRAALQAELEDIHDVVCLGELPIQEQYFAISIERRVRHPAVNALIESARQKLTPVKAPPRP